jgi:hypothetical protein
MKPTYPETALTVPRPEGRRPAFFAVGERDPGLTGSTLKVFLLGGQSNMVGSGTDVGDLPPALRGPQDDVLFFYGGTSSPISLQPGSGSQYGPEITFGRAMADAFPGQSIALIKHAQGGTDLQNQWDPATGSVYANFRTVVADGLEALARAGHTNEIVGMLWTQGERDARLGYGASYEANLNEFIADVRARYGADLPFLLSQLSALQTNLPADGLDQVRQAQANVAATDPNSHLVVTDSFGMRSDNLHFSGAGQVALGQGFADAYLQSSAIGP